MRAIFIRIGQGLLLLLFLGGCEKSSSSSGRPPAQEKEKEQEGPVVYEVQVEQKKICSLGRVLVNGFPVDKWGGQAVHQKYDFSVNTALVGEGNVLTVENEPCFSTGGEDLSIGPIKMEVGVKGKKNNWVEEGKITVPEVDSAYQHWKRQARDQWKEYRGNEASLDSIRAWAERNPLTVSATFDNEAGPDFSRIFEEAPVIEGTAADTARLREYAMRLRSLVAAGNGAGLYREIRPASEAAAREIGKTPPPFEKKKSSGRKTERREPAGSTTRRRRLSART